MSLYTILGNKYKFDKYRKFSSSHYRRNHYTIIFDLFGIVICSARNEQNLKIGVLNLHSEEAAIMKLRKLIRKGIVTEKRIRKGIYVFNFAINKSNDIKICKPCLNCAKLLKECEFRILNIFWYNSGGEIEECSQEDVDSDAVVSTGDVWRHEKLV